MSTRSPMPPDRPARLSVGRLDTPIGTMLIVADERDHVRALDWADHQTRMHRLLHRHYGAQAGTLIDARVPEPVRDAVIDYFDGDLRAVDRLPAATAGTPFQRRVWAALRAIPAGTTMSYATLAAHIGAPRAVRAVGLANGANPIGIIVPCHRVVGAGGSLTGYGGGLARKRWLLEHEGAIASAGPPAPVPVFALELSS